MEGSASVVESLVVLAPVLPGADQDGCEDACSICLEPFSSYDPATVTDCRHEYHLQCILEWSQRSKECPMCWQLLVLKDPASQELLAAVEIERNSRARQSLSNTRLSIEDFQFSHDAPYTDDSDFDEHIMRHLAAAALGRSHLGRRERRRPSGMDPPPHVFVFASPENRSVVQETYSTAPTETQNHMLFPNGSPETILPSANNDRPPSSPLSSHINMSSDTLDHRYGPFRPGVLFSQTPPSIPQSSRSSELLSFSESLKSRFSAASAKYKESISRSTRGFREKLLARNSVKELSREVQREVSAGVARMMERLDPISKRSGDSAPPSRSNEGTSGFSYNGKSVQENLIVHSRNRNDVETVHGTNSNATFHVSGSLSSIPGHLEVRQAQDML